MTRRCDSNPAQYERNRRFGHLVHALGRAAGGAKLPSVGLCLNASKAVSFLVKGGNDISRSLVSRKAQNNVTLLGGRSSWPVFALALIAVWGRGSDLGISPGVGQASSGRSWVYPIVRCRDSESSVDDLEQLPRCDLLRLSPWLGDSSCRKDEAQPSPLSFVVVVVVHDLYHDPIDDEDERLETTLGGSSKSKLVVARLAAAPAAAAAQHQVSTSSWSSGEREKEEEEFSRSKKVISNDAFLWPFFFSFFSWQCVRTCKKKKKKERSKRKKKISAILAQSRCLVRVVSLGPTATKQCVRTCAFRATRPDWRRRCEDTDRRSSSAT
ncbi:unnamed protein product [Trichogramma brassicae]|uniref:Uncharacterized protein n=1 Tax=Trichogramma brassicae TaxID=86971 RepID=A0A6H5IAC3_9HYME|nr:unnamed protein product [Trichogramma brassicae]